MGGSSSLGSLPVLDKKDIEVEQKSDGKFAKIISGKLIGTCVRCQHVNPKEIEDNVLKKIGKLKHKNIVSLLAFVKVSKKEWNLLWERTEESIYEYFESYTAIDETRLQMADGLVRGLAFMHSLNLYHLRLTPKKIAFQKGVIKIADFWLGEKVTESEKEEKKDSELFKQYLISGDCKDEKDRINADKHSLGMCLKYIWIRARGKNRQPPTRHEKMLTVIDSILHGKIDLIKAQKEIEGIIKIGSGEQAPPSDSEGGYLQGLQILASPHGGDIPEQLPNWYIQQQLEHNDGLGIEPVSEGAPPIE
mmetsp:Transcript_15229/g.23049  ORF Transcript_15229/g.23049 Transcript_15229/m.23049 type:complete len:305 (+) Transcript_15229:67-981(+)